MTISEYRMAVSKRNAVISANRSRLMRRLPSLPVPPKPEIPLVPIAYAANGDYLGRLSDASECPQGATVRWQEAQY